MFAASVLLAAALAASPSAVNEAKPQILTHIEWTRLPSVNDFAGHYPRRAQSAEVPGWALIGCGVDAKGKLGGCKLAAETPTGYGFGEATLALAPKFEMKAPPTGAGLSNARVIIPVYWALPGRAAPRVNYEPGSPSMVVTIAPQSQKGPGFFTCPSETDKSRYCQAHRIEWEKQPGIMEVDDLIRKAHGGASSMECTISDTGALENCIVANNGPLLTEADFTRLSKLFRAPTRTVDHVITKGNHVVLSFDWTKLANILAAFEGS